MRVPRGEELCIRCCCFLGGNVLSVASCRKFCEKATNRHGLEIFLVNLVDWQCEERWGFNLVRLFCFRGFRLLFFLFFLLYFFFEVAFLQCNLIRRLNCSASVISEGLLEFFESFIILHVDWCAIVVGEFNHSLMLSFLLFIASTHWHRIHGSFFPRRWLLIAVEKICRVRENSCLWVYCRGVVGIFQCWKSSLAMLNTKWILTF